MSRWAERAIEVEAHAAMGGVEHAQAVIARELESAWRAGMIDAAKRAGDDGCFMCADVIRAEAAK